MKEQSRSRDLASAGALFAGGALLLLAFIFSNIVAALAGIAVAFWGLLILYVSDTGYVKAEVVVPTLEGQAAVVKQLLENSRIVSDGVHVPPKSIGEVSAEKVVLGDETAQTAVSGEGSLLAHSFAVPAPGLALVKYYQEHSGSDFLGVNFEYLKGTLSSLMVEELEIAQSFEIKMEENVITISATGRRFYELCTSMADEETEKRIGCPIHSSFAIILARAFGRPIAITSVDRSARPTIVTKYKVL